MKKSQPVSQGAAPKDLDDLDQDFEDGIEDDEGEGSGVSSPITVNEDVDPKVANFLKRLVNDAIARMPGAATLAKKRPKDERPPIMKMPALAKHIEESNKGKPEKEHLKLVNLTLAPRGELGGEYHSKFFHIYKPGTYDGIPDPIARGLAKDHPRDFKVG